MTGQPVCFEVDGLTYAGLAWGPEDGRPVLALHGWMDHADSFAQLAPRLTGCRVVALDLSGQGRSSHRAAHATYNIWDDLPQIVAVLEQLGWQDCVLMGHSRGANIGALLAAAVPERVRVLVSLDALVPEPSEVPFAETLGKFVTGTRAQKDRAPRLFESTAAYAERRAAQGNSEATAKALADRALTPVDGGFEMRADRRLFASSAVKLSEADVRNVMQSIRCPLLNIWAEGGILNRYPRLAALAEAAPQIIADYTRETVPGDHHFHMAPESVEEIADVMLAFLAARDL